MKKSSDGGVDNFDDDAPVPYAFSRPPVPAELEARGTRSLSESGLIDAAAPRRGVPRFGSVWRIAAGVALFLAGFASAQLRQGGDTPPGNSAPGDRYALLFYPGGANDRGVDDVAANRSWAHELIAAGHEVSGEKLDPGGVLVANLGDLPAGTLPDGPPLQGFFVISAGSEAEALSIARSSPHFRNGGRIVVTRIEPT